MKELEGHFDPLGDSKDGYILTRAIIDTIREPLIVLDENLNIIVASRSFYKKFRQTPEDIQGKRFYEIKDGRFDVPKLRELLERIIPDKTTVEGYEVEYPSLKEDSMRTIVINARAVQYNSGEKKMLLSFFDMTNQKNLESEKDTLLAQKELLLKEMRHRIANSLQIIASILLLKAETVSSKESKTHLEEVHTRIMSIASAQQQLEPVEQGKEIAVGHYLTTLCKNLARSMIGGRKPITLEVIAEEGFAPSDTTISFGLMTTELVINALKHGFPNGQQGHITVTYKNSKKGWSLSVEDNGIGQTEDGTTPRRGLGTSIIGALANQLHAIITTETSKKGTKVSITHTVL